MKGRATRRRRLPLWLRWSLGIALLAVLAVAAAVWWHQDLPRRLVRQAIADKLGADVSLGRLEILGTRAFRLHELCLRQLADLPQVERLCIGRLDVEASLEEAQAGRFERLHAHDTRVRLQRVDPSWSPPPAVDPPPPVPRVAEFLLDPARLSVRVDGQTSELEATGQLRNVGTSSLSGRLTVATTSGQPATPLAPLLALVELPAEQELQLRRRAGRNVGPLQAEVWVDAGRLTKLDLDVTLDGTDAESILPAASTLPPPFPLQVQFTGQFEPPGTETYTEAISILPPLPRSLTGTLQLRPGERLPRLDAEGRWPLDLEGDVDLTWQTSPLDLTLVPLRYTTTSTAAGQRGTDLQVIGSASANGSLKGTWMQPRVQADVTGSRLTARLLSSASTTPSMLRRGRLRARASWTPAPHTLDALGDEPAPLELRQVELDGEVTLPQLASARGVELTLNADLGIRAGTPWARFTDAHLQLDGIGRLQGQGSFDSGEPRPLHADLTIDSDAFTPEGLQALLHPDLAARLPLDAESSYGGEFAARGLRLQLDALGDEIPAWRLQGPLELRGGNYTSGDYSRVIEGLDLDLRLDVHNHVQDNRGEPTSDTQADGESESADVPAAAVTAGERIAVDVRLRDPRPAKSAAGTGLQVLWGAVYADLSGAALDLHLEGHVEGLTGNLPSDLTSRLNADLTLDDGPEIQAEIQLDPQLLLRLDTEITWPDLGPGHERYLRPTFPDALGDLELAGSLHLSASTRVQLREASPESKSATPTSAGTAPSTAPVPALLDQLLASVRESLHGRLHLDDLAATSTDGETQLAGVALDLPFDLRPAPATRSAAGSLAFHRFRFRGLEIQGTLTPLRSDGDNVRVTEPLVLPLFDGHVELRQLALRDLLDPAERRVEMAVQLRQLQLARAAETLGLFPLEGSVEGQLPSITLRAGRDGDGGGVLGSGELHVEGGGEVSVFGGRVRIGDISGSDILTGYPRFVFSADFEAIDLLQVTRRFDFGEMTGLVRGELRDCELFRGTPVRLRARLETIEEDDLSRTVSVKAVRNLTILGTGAQSATLLDRGLQRLFDRYTYASLGVEMQLDNDVFLLRGLERRGDKELFLRGRLPLPIDVVNAQPGRTVSFQAMLRRLENLDFSAVRTE